MGGWKRRVGSVLLAGTEVVLAATGVATVAALVDIGRGVESGAYNREAAAGFGFAFLLVWALAYLALTALLAGHAIAWTFRSPEGDRVDRLVEALPRLGVELVVGVVLTASFFESGMAEVFGSVLLASAVVGLTVLVHVAVDASVVLKRAVPAR